jgi:hypothetical protein
VAICLENKYGYARPGSQDLPAGYLWLSELNFDCAVMIGPVFGFDGTMSNIFGTISDRAGLEKNSDDVGYQIYTRMIGLGMCYSCQVAGRESIGVATNSKFNEISSWLDKSDLASSSRSRPRDAFGPTLDLFKVLNSRKTL